MTASTPTELEKIISGKDYNPTDPELSRKRWQAREMLNEWKGIPYQDWTEKRKLWQRLFGHTSNDLTIELPFLCDYGFNIHLGKKVFINFDCIFLDSAPIHIGDRVMIAPSVKIFTASHSLNHRQRNSGVEFANPISIGSDVWIGGGAIINPGVTIGDRSVIGSGSVVTRHIPADVLAAGNPARVIKTLNDSR